MKFTHFIEGWFAVNGKKFATKGNHRPGMQMSHRRVPSSTTRTPGDKTINEKWRVYVPTIIPQTYTIIPLDVPTIIPLE